MPQVRAEPAPPAAAIRGVDDFISRDAGDLPTELAAARLI
jgi:hypothetical protein